ncbi:hypothetical protein [Campylobacter sp. RM12651]|uniref:hypothetical protein n=1 Tax=Campylobacter sp. RM12651 TaxID=1660079 RepID=UPI001EFB97E2|nr:hypothetical protein [Campylobacter sp. RM12651]ULO03827.1 putative membrane protein [Campylobacter sp. RM12651]
MLKIIKKEFAMILEFWLLIPIILILISLIIAIPIGAMAHYKIINEPQELIKLIYLYQLGVCFIIYLFFSLGYLISKKIRNIYDDKITLVKENTTNYNGINSNNDLVNCSCNFHDSSSIIKHNNYRSNNTDFSTLAEYNNGYSSLSLDLSKNLFDR